MTSAGMLVGHDRQHQAVRVPVAARVTHTLVLGATGAGKTVTQAWMLGRAIDAGHAVVCVDPKGDGPLLCELHAAAQRNGRRFALWTPEGPCSYNPFAHGSDSELADKALAGEDLHRAALPVPGAALRRAGDANAAGLAPAGDARVPDARP